MFTISKLADQVCLVISSSNFFCTALNKMEDRRRRFPYNRRRSIRLAWIFESVDFFG
jgi:hypothetical protein